MNSKYVCTCKIKSINHAKKFFSKLSFSKRTTSWCLAFSTNPLQVLTIFSCSQQDFVAIYILHLYIDTYIFYISCVKLGDKLALQQTKRQSWPDRLP